MKVCIHFVLLITAVLSHTHTYKCVFDEHNQDLREAASKNVPEVPVIPPGTHVNGRLLVTPSTSFYNNIRIYLDTIALTNTTITPGVNGAGNTTTTKLNFILQALYVAQQFYQTRIKAAQLSFITIPNYCVDFAPSNNGTQIANTQLVIFAQYLTDANRTYGATGKSCDYVSGTLPDNTLQVGRPSVGRIIFNTYTLVDQESSLTNRLFQSVTATTLHEIMHILGFDSTLYSTYLDVTTGNNYASGTYQIIGSTDVNSNRPSTNILTTPYVKAWARQHFGCSTLPGMLLENQDSTGSGSGSHWQRTAIYDELMTATSFGPSSKGISGLSFALLKDTGWYLVDDTFSETTNYGYQKGCSFVLDACYSNSSAFSQFCNSASSNISYCQTTFFSKAQCTSQASAMSDSCGIYFPYFSCVDPTSVDPGYQPYTSQVYAPNSFCVLSTLGTVTIPSSYQSRCYPYVCGTSSIVFTIGSYSITCLSTEQGVTKTLSALAGSLTCPIFSDFCTNSRKTCKNWCSKNGFCSDGVCNCLSTNFGSDCSVTSCTAGQFYDPTSSTCGSSCPSGTYQNSYSHTCQACQSPCSQCINTATNCISCVSSSAQKYYYNSVCYSVCPNTTYTSGYQCIACDQTVNCLTCSGSATTCTSCMNGRYLNQGNCVVSCTAPYATTDLVHNTCVSACPSYLLTASSTCVYCSNGTYLMAGACVANCSSGSSTTYYPDDSYHACMQCSTSCNTCDGPYPQNCTSCVSTSGTPYLLLKMCWAICPKGFYANPTTGKCEVCPVQLSCQACKYSTNTSSAYCTSCIYGTFFYSANSTCITSCNTNQYKNTWNNSCNSCDSSCVTCNGPSSFSCLSCPSPNLLLTNSTGGYCLSQCPTIGYVIVGAVCQSCDSTCKTCNGISASQCSTCQSAYYLYNGYCRYICPAATYPDSTTQTCLACDSTCSYCFNGTAQSCTSCVSGKYLYNFTCGASCPAGMNPNQWNVCFELFQKLSLMLLGVVAWGFI